jgi:hypothetical protein
LYKGKLFLLTPCCCGRRDGSMIFNPNDCEVAPPQSNGVSPVHAKGVCANPKVSWYNKRWLLGEIKNIVMQQKMSISVKTKVSWRYKRWHLGEIINIVA